MQSSHVQNGAQLPGGSGNDPPALPSPLRISHVECLLWLWWIWMLCDCISNLNSSSGPHFSGIQYTTWQHTHFHIMPHQRMGNWGRVANGGMEVAKWKAVGQQTEAFWKMCLVCDKRRRENLDRVHRRANTFEDWLRSWIIGYDIQKIYEWWKIYC